MTSNPSVREQALREADEGVFIPCTKVCADTGGEPNRARTKYRKFREPSSGEGRSRSSKISAKAPGETSPTDSLQDGNPAASVKSGQDFYQAACIEAHRLLNRP
jgi:hypothetical protein